MSAGDLWRFGPVARLGTATGLLTYQGLRLGPFGLLPLGSALSDGANLGRNYRGERLRWGLLAQPSGRLLCAVRNPSIGARIAAALVALDPAMWSDDPPADRYRVVGPILARWSCEGDAACSDVLRDGALEVAAEVPGWGR